MSPISHINNSVWDFTGSISTVEIFGVAIHNLDIQEAVGLICRSLDETMTTHICFVNANCLNIAERDSEYKQVLQGADLVLPDGIGVKLASKFLRQPTLYNSNGTDLFPQLCTALDRRRQRIYLLGGKLGVARQVKSWLETNFSEIEVCGYHHGYFSDRENDQIVRDIRVAQPDLLIAAMGVPYQEKWLATYGEATGAKSFMGMGGLFDFYSGRISRAPTWMRKFGCEWFYRLLQEPKRLWRRYSIGNCAFVFGVGRQQILTWLPGNKIETEEVEMFGKVRQGKINF